jgi:acetyl-CoA decarbonylase/synthase complex subunit delta
MNLGSSAAGYGYEYLASTLDRVKAAALAQNDAMLQMPIVTPVSTEAWGVKEAMLAEAEAPEGWGSQEERGIEMEITTAAACLVGGSNVVIMKHPAAIAATAKFIDSLM